NIPSFLHSELGMDGVVSEVRPLTGTTHVPCSTGILACVLSGAALINIAWNPLPPMPTGVAGGASGLLEGTLIYAGGTTWADGVKLWLRDIREYDFAKRAWASGPSLPEPLAYG